MKINRLTTTHMLLSAGAIVTAMLAACSDDIVTIDKNEEYTRAFVKQFGLYDTTHDWNIATRAGVDVTTDKPSDIRVIAEIGGKQYLLAHYKDVSGSRHIAFDIPKGINEVSVSDDFYSYKVALGAKVDFARGSRAIWQGGDSKVTISSDDYRILTDDEVMAYSTYLPEETDNLGKVTQNFTFVANGDFIIYPIFWQTNSYNTIGIYYIDEEANEMVHIPFYTHRMDIPDGTQGNLLYTKGDPYAEDKVPAKENIPLKDGQEPMDAAAAINQTTLNPVDYNDNGLTSFLDFGDEDWLVFKQRYLHKMRAYNQYNWANYNQISSKFDVNYFTDNDYFSWSNSAVFQVSDIQCSARDANSVDITAISVLPINDWINCGDVQCSHPGDGVQGWKSRGIHVSIAPGTKFGMYNRTWYSAGDQGEDKKPSIDNVKITRLPLDEDRQPISDGYTRWYSDAEYNHPKNVPNVFASTYMYETSSGLYRVFGFEDYDGGVQDLNDMMFFITSEKPAEIPGVEDIDHPKMSWILAVEDLGTTDDFDFNDLVLMIEHVSGETTATITPLAAGGTLPMRIFYNDQEISGSGNFAHVNQFFGIDDYTVMLNTGRATGTAESVTIEVPEDFSMADLQGVVDSKMGGFHIKVKQSGEGVEGNWTDDVIDITAAEAGAVPQILCLPGTWQWPLERVNICDAYPRIKEWISNKETNTDWYLSPVGGKVWRR